MRSTFSISSAKVCFSLLAAACLMPTAMAEAENYSLWPQRPKTIIEARSLMDKGELESAIKMLQPLVTEPGIVGKEVRELIGSLRIRQLLDAKGPGIKTYTVRRGDSWLKMVNRMKSTQALVMHLNGLMTVPALQPGDKYKYRPADFRLVVHVPEKEVCLYEGVDFVKAYPIVDMKDTGKKNFETKLKAEQASETIYSPRYASADRCLLLAAGGFVIDAKNGALRAPGFYLSRQDCNELAMFVKPGAQVSIVREKGTPIPAPLTEAEEGAGRADQSGKKGQTSL